MNFQQFVDGVNRRMGVRIDESDVLGAADYLAHFIPAIDARPMAPSLPVEVVERLASDRDLRLALDLDVAAAELGEHITLPAGRALELFETVCRTIDDALVGEARIHFRRNLPDELVVGFERSAALPRQAPEHPNEMGAGRPGSMAPIGEANPAQADSVARDVDPHRETKLSESRGMTQERERRTLADGEPGSTRSLGKPH